MLRSLRAVDDFTEPPTCDLLNSKMASWLQIFLAVLFPVQLWAVPVYTVGIEDVDLSPIVAIAPHTKKCIGYACEVLQEFARRKKIRFRYVPLPVSRAHLQFWNGEVDFMFPDHPSWSMQEKEERKLKIYYSNHLLSFQDAVLVRPYQVGKGIERIKVMGTIRGFTIWKLQPLVNAKTLKMIGAPTPDASIQMALAGRVDAVTMPLQIANFHLKKLKRVGALVPDPDLLPLQESFYYLSTIRHPELIKEFNFFIQKEESFLVRLRSEVEKKFEEF